MERPATGKEEKRRSTSKREIEEKQIYWKGNEHINFNSLE